jgi:hypothetical protein
VCVCVCRCECVCTCVCVCVFVCVCVCVFLAMCRERDMERHGDCLTSNGNEGSSEVSFSDSRTPLSYLYLTLYPILTLYLNLCLPVYVRAAQMGMTTKDQYVHRLGRTARAGKEGSGLLLCAPFEASGMLPSPLTTHLPSSDTLSSF